MAAIRVRPDYAPGELLVVASRDLVQTVSDLVDGLAGAVQFDSGSLPFDVVCVKLGLQAVAHAWPELRMLHLYFGKYLNPEAAAGSFAEVEEVDLVSPNMLVGDGSDVEVEPLGAGWRVVVRNMFGDCPSACLEEEIRVFVVDGARVREVGPEEPVRAGGGLSHPVRAF